MGKPTRTAVTGSVAERVAQMMQALATPSRVHRVLYRLHDDHMAFLLDEAVFHMQHLDLGEAAQRRTAS